MSGFAYAGFICGTRDCYAEYQVDLITDGQYPYYHVHDGWHIELGTDWPVNGTVRCPRHCEFVGTSLAAGGYWKDAP